MPKPTNNVQVQGVSLKPRTLERLASLQAEDNYMARVNARQLADCVCFLTQLTECVEKPLKKKLMRHAANLAFIREVFNELKA